METNNKIPSGNGHHEQSDGGRYRIRPSDAAADVVIPRELMQRIIRALHVTSNVADLDGCDFITFTDGCAELVEELEQLEPRADAQRERLLEALSAVTDLARELGVAAREWIREKGQLGFPEITYKVTDEAVALLDIIAAEVAR